MPIYEYRCENDHRFELIQKFTDDAVSVCEVCGAPAQRVLHPVAIHFKGRSPGVFVYDPSTNSWADPIPFPADVPEFRFAANTCFDPELNAYFCHVAGDSSDNGVMWVYRYKR